MKNKLTARLSVKKQLLYIIEGIINIINTMNHPEYNVLMQDTDTEELLRLSKQAKEIIKEWKEK